jgi:hypothetical protein
MRSLLAHLVLLLLRLAEGNVLFGGGLVEAASAELAFREVVVAGVIQDLLLLLRGHVVVV